MATLAPLLDYLRQTSAADAGDAELLERFVRHADETAFATLVQRHGPMVLAVCRRVLGDTDDAEDAFQATFLLLVSKAAELRQPELLGPWLHGVAQRTALKAKCARARHRRREQPLDDYPAADHDDLLWHDLRPVLDDAIRRLAPRYRVPFVLCYLEGLTNAQAARQLGCPEGTIATWLARARQQLRARLTRRGLGVSACLLATALSADAGAKMPPALFAATVQAARSFALGRVLNGGIPARVLVLTQGVSRAMFMDKLRHFLSVLVLLALCGAGGLLTYQAFAAEPPEPRLPPRSVSALLPSDEADTPTKHRTANFVIDAPSARVARLVGEAAERQRRELAVRWLGKELPAWGEPCPLKVTLGLGKGSGSTSFAFDQGKILSRSMHMEGVLERVLANHLPHEITHAVFADHFRAPVPRWADEGGAVLAEDEEEQRRHDKLTHAILDAPGRAMPLRRLFAVRDYPRDVLVLYAEGYSVTRFLVERKDHRTFLAFVKQGMRDGWDKAVQAHYDWKSVEDLERDWLEHLRRHRRPEAEQQIAPPGIPQEAGKPEARSRKFIGPPPRVVLARRAPDGKIEVRVAVAEDIPQTVRVRDGAEERSVTTYVRTMRDRTYVLPRGVIEVFDVSGERVEEEALKRRLSKETAVLLSGDGKPVDPFHLQVVQEGTLVLVTPALSPGAFTPRPDPETPVPELGNIGREQMPRQ
jgi:RNA polymerase sigma factor (sigma-70 family)